MMPIANKLSPVSSPITMTAAVARLLLLMVYLAVQPCAAAAAAAVNLLPTTTTSSLSHHRWWRTAAKNSSVVLETPTQLGNRTKSPFWFPNSITRLPSGQIISRVSVHADAKMEFNFAALFASVDNGRSFTELTPQCGAAHLAGCRLPGLPHPTDAWTLAIPQPGNLLLSIPFQPRFVPGSQGRSLALNATLLQGLPSGGVRVRQPSVAVTVVNLPGAVQFVPHDHSLPYSNVYTGAGVPLSDGSRLALLYVVWRNCTRAPPQNLCTATLTMVSKSPFVRWQFRGTVKDKVGDEGELLKLEDNRILAIMRHDDASGLPGCRQMSHGQPKGKECTFWQSLSSDEGRTWSTTSLMGVAGGVDGGMPPPHSVMPQALRLSRGGYLISGGRSGLYLWHCATLHCVDQVGGSCSVRPPPSADTIP
eukprot:COSAG05_NODE_101_length_19100_cov_24.260144_7_plen_420_part_00